MTALLRVEPTSQNDFGPCECCGAISRTAWGWVHEGPRTLAAYYVQWKLGQVARHGAYFDFIVGPWGEGADASTRVAVCLRFRRGPQGPSFMVVDATDRPTTRGPLAARPLLRDEVVDTPFAKRVYAMVDALWLQDARIREVSGNAG